MGPKVKKLCHGLGSSDIWITALMWKMVGVINLLQSTLFETPFSFWTLSIVLSWKIQKFKYVLEVSSYHLGLGKQVGEHILC